MTDERDAKVSAAYRRLGADEPPRVLDEAILAAARRSARPWTRRWGVPLSLAAVLVLSVTVTLRIQHEQPGIEMPAPVKKEVARVDRPAAAAPQEQAPTSAKAAADLAVRAPPQKPSLRREAEAFPGASQDRAAAENRAAAAAPAAVPSAATQAEAPALAKRADADAGSVAGSAAGAVAPPPAPAVPAAPAMRAMQRERVAADRMEARRPALTPERELERIADLRKEQKHDEADKALAEFRKHYPDFRIPEAMRERVERR